MTTTVWGAVLGALAGTGVIVVVSRLRELGRPRMATRVLPYLRDLPRIGTAPALAVATPAPVSGVSGVFGPPLRSAADAVERVLGGATSVRRRLERAGLDKSVHELRIEQVMWGLAAFAAAAAWSLVRALSDPSSLVSSLLLCAAAFACGVLGRDHHLSSQVTARERRILQEFPTLAELLALAVAAGESPVAALDRVVRRSGGELSRELGRVLAAIRTGEPVAAAFDGLAARTGVALVARFAEGVAVAVERGTPLAEVLHAQAADVREAGRRGLIEVAARKEVFMMVPVVFLVLPVTILFAFWPGAVGIGFSTP